MWDDRPPHGRGFRCLGADGGGGPEQARVASEVKVRQSCRGLVVIKEFGSKPISILGCRPAPGALNVSGRWFLLQAISAAGGLTESRGPEDLHPEEQGSWPSDIMEVRRRPPERVRRVRGTYPSIREVVNIRRDPWSGSTACRGQVAGSRGNSLRTTRLRSCPSLQTAGADRPALEDDSVVNASGYLGKDVETVYEVQANPAGKDPDPELRSTTSSSSRSLLL